MKAHGFYFAGCGAGLSAFFSHVGSTAMAWACELCFVLFPAFYYYPSCRLWAGRGGREKRQAVWVRTGAGSPLLFPQLIRPDLPFGNAICAVGPISFVGGRRAAGLPFYSEIYWFEAGGIDT